MLKNAILAATADAADRILAHRRHLHLHPEPSYAEIETGRYISQALTGMGIAHTTGWGAERGLGRWGGRRWDVRRSAKFGSAPEVRSSVEVRGLASDTA